MLTRAEEDPVGYATPDPARLCAKPRTETMSFSSVLPIAKRPPSASVRGGAAVRGAAPERLRGEEGAIAMVRVRFTLDEPIATPPVVKPGGRN